MNAEGDMDLYADLHEGECCEVCGEPVNVFVDLLAGGVYYHLECCDFWGSG